jgi:methionine-gamma-lyase
VKKTKKSPANSIQDLQFFGEFGGVNPSISDSSTFTYLAGKTMGDVFGGTREGCYLYSRHTNPSTSYLGQAIAQMKEMKWGFLMV